MIKALASLLLLVPLASCLATTVVGTAVGVGGAVVGTAVRTTGAVVGAAIPDGDKEHRNRNHRRDDDDGRN